MKLDEYRRGKYVWLEGETEHTGEMDRSDAPANEPKQATAKFDPSQKRNSKGEWTDGIPGPSVGGDKLKLASRIQLGEGETLLSSRKFKSSEYGWDLLAAEVDTPGGRQVRLGVIKPSESKHWTAGPNPKRDARVGEIDAELARLDDIGDVTWTDDQAERYEVLRVERSELVGEADDDGLNRTATLTPEDVSRLRADLDKGAQLGREHTKTFLAWWASPDGVRLEELGEMRRQAGFSKPEFQRSEEDLRRLAEFEAEHGEEIGRLLASSPEADATLIEGSIESPDGFDLVYSVRGTDDGEGGWDVAFGVKPTDPEELDGWFPGANDDRAVFDPKDIKALLAGLAELAGGGEVTAKAADGDELRHYWTKTSEGLAKWADSPHPWTALVRHLTKHVGKERAERIASQWFHQVFGIWPGERFGDNPTGPG